MSFLSTRRFFCLVLPSSYSDFSSSSWLSGGRYYNPSSSFFILTRKLNQNNQKHTLQLIRWLCIFRSLPNSKPLLVLLHTNLIDYMLRSLLIDDRGLPLDVLILRRLLHVLVRLDVICKPLVFVSHLDEEFFNLS